MPNQKHQGKGQALVEFALVFPLLLILIFGIIEFGRLIFAYASTIAASREAARYGAAIQDIEGGLPQYKDCEGIRAAAKRIGGITGISDDNISIQYRNELKIYDPDCPPNQTVELADQIVVTINSSFTPFPILNLPTIPLNSSSSRSIIKEVEIGKHSTGAGSSGTGSSTVNFRATYQTAIETDDIIEVTIDLSEPVSDNVEIPYTLSGTAEEGSDYKVDSLNPITIENGYTETSIKIRLVNDRVVEGNETLILELGTPVNADRGSQTTHGIIIEDPPEIYFDTTTSTSSEGDGAVYININLNKVPKRDITVQYSPGGEAIPGYDYTPTPTVIEFPAYTSTLFRTLTLNIKDDDIDEINEDVILTLNNPINAILGSNHTHTHTITNNDKPPAVAFQVPSQTVSEGLTLVTTVILSSPSGKEVSVKFFPTNISTESGDYSILTPSPLVFSPGSTQADILIEISENDGYNTSTDALTEEFELTLENPKHATTRAPSSQLITITEDANTPKVTFLTPDQTVFEDTGLFSIPVIMSNASASEVKVDFSRTGTATHGEDNDYIINSNNPLTILPGDTVGEIEVQVLDDEFYEGASENFTLEIDPIENGELGDVGSHTVTIIDNDSQPLVNFQRPNQTVGEQIGSVLIYADLSAPSTEEIVVSLSLGGTATFGEDYNATSPVEIVFPQGATSSSFSISLLDDTHYDNNETISLTMDSVTNGVQGNQNQHTITITDNELPPCDVGTYLLTAGNAAITWELVNDGQDIVFTDGVITWPEESIGKPRLKSISFGGAEIFSGNTTPGTLSFPESGTASEPFPSTSTLSLYFEFSSNLGSGSHEITANFKVPATGEICSASISYNNPY